MTSPFYTLSVCSPLCPSPCTLGVPWHSVTDPISNILHLQGCTLANCNVRDCLQFLDCPSISMADQVCFLSLFLLCLSVRFVSLCLFSLWLPPFPQYLIGQGPSSDNLNEINIPIFRIHLSISVSDQVWFFLLPPLFVHQVCVSICSCLWLSSFLIIPFCINKLLDQTPLKEQTLSPSTYPYSVIMIS